MPKTRREAGAGKVKSASKGKSSQAVATPALNNAASAVMRLEKELQDQAKKMAEARKRAAGAKEKAASSGRVRDKNSAEKAAAGVTKPAGRTKSTRARAAAATTRAANLKDKARIDAIRTETQAALVKLKAEMDRKAQADAQKALQVFEISWWKKRSRADAEKLQAAEKSAAAKINAVESKAAAKARAAEKKAAAAAKKSGGNKNIKATGKITGRPEFASKSAKEGVAKKKRAAR